MLYPRSAIVLGSLLAGAGLSPAVAQQAALTSVPPPPISSEPPPQPASPVPGPYYDEDDPDFAYSPQPNGDSADSNIGFNVNVLGLVTLGPTIALEFGGRAISFSARFRAMNAGLLSYVLVADAFGDGETLGFSYGLAGALRVYMGRDGNMRGFFLGPGVEYISTRVEDEDLVAYDTQLIVPEMELGYRWVWGRFLLDVGGGLGYAIVIDRTSELLPGGDTLWENDAENSFYAVGTVAIGALF